MNKLICIFAVVMGMMFTSCDKEEVVNPDTKNKENILVFKSVEEFNNTLTEVNAMSEPERLEWERQQRFKSFGTISSERYYSIDFSKYKNVEEIKNDVAIQQYVKVLSEDNETYVLPKETNNRERYLMNEDAMYIIGNRVVKYYDGQKISTHISQLNILKETTDYLTALKKINVDEEGMNKVLPDPNIEIEENTDRVKIFKKYDNSKTYMLRIHTAVYRYWIPSETRKQVFFIIQNYKKGFLGIYWLKNYSTQFRFDIRTTDDNNHNLNLLRSLSTQVIDSQDFNIETICAYGNTFDSDTNCTIYYADFMVNNGYVSMNCVLP
ncbi:MAG: hypothetical protein VB102_03950 [Paludibacter sp.]|nr:hypothetical protein [Paludibacter sp.]